MTQTWFHMDWFHDKIHYYLFFPLSLYIIFYNWVENDVGIVYVELLLTKKNWRKTNAWKLLKSNKINEKQNGRSKN